MTTELLVTAVFEALRWIVRALTLTRRQHPSAAATASRQRRLAAAAAAVDTAAGNTPLGSSSVSSGNRLSRRTSSTGSNSGRVRPGSPVIELGAKALRSPFACAGLSTAAAAAEAGDRTDGSDGRGVVRMFTRVSPRIDPGEEQGMLDCLQQQQQQQYGGSSVSPQRSGSVSSYYSGRSSSSSGGSESGDDELWGVGEKPTTLLRSKSVGGDLVSAFLVVALSSCYTVADWYDSGTRMSACMYVSTGGRWASYHKHAVTLT